MPKKRNEEKKMLTLSVSEKLIDRFRDSAFGHYQQIDRLDLFSYSDYLKVCLLNFEKHLLEQHIDLVEPENSYLDFYSRKGNINTLDQNDYSRTNVTSMTLRLDEYDQVYNKMMHTYFLNFCKGYKNYSTSFFFYDLLNIIYSDRFNFTHYDVTS